MMYRVAADAVAAVHVGWVLTVVFGLVAVLVGGARGWAWVRNPWVRGGHLAMIGLVVARALVWSDVCPLTAWEYQLRDLAGQDRADVWWFFLAVLHPGLPRWAYPVVYSVFGLLVVAAFWLVPVRWADAAPRDDLSCRPQSSP